MSRASAPGTQAPVGGFCWTDLAATDARAAADFYQRMFGWRPAEQAANGGRFTRLALDGRDVGSLYQLRRAALEAGVGSHWTPYVRVADARAAALRAASLGGCVRVPAFEVEGIARIALVEDAVGALLGLWEAPDRPA